MASRITDRARLLGVSPRALLLALVRNYADHPELYGVEVHAHGRPELHRQGTLFPTEGSER